MFLTRINGTSENRCLCHSLFDSLEPITTTTTTTTLSCNPITTTATTTTRAMTITTRTTTSARPPQSQSDPRPGLQLRLTSLPPLRRPPPPGPAGSDLLVFPINTIAFRRLGACCDHVESFLDMDCPPWLAVLGFWNEGVCRS